MKFQNALNIDKVKHLTQITHLFHNFINIHNDLKRKRSSKMHKLRYCEQQMTEICILVSLSWSAFIFKYSMLWSSRSFTFSTACFRSPTWKRCRPLD